MFVVSLFEFSSHSKLQLELTGLLLRLNPHLDSKGNIIVSHRIIRSWYTGPWWVGCYVWYIEEGTGWGRSPLMSLLAVSNVAAHPSTASVPIIVLVYNGRLLCSCNVRMKGLFCSEVCCVVCTQRFCTLRSSATWRRYFSRCTRRQRATTRCSTASRSSWRSTVCPSRSENASSTTSCPPGHWRKASKPPRFALTRWATKTRQSNFDNNSTTSELICVGRDQCSYSTPCPVIIIKRLTLL